MSSITDIKDELNELTTMKFISQAFTEAAAFKLRSIRASFEKNRQFYEDISYLYHLVQVNANKRDLEHSKKKNKKIKPRVLYVALTSNKHFYGNLNINIMTSFIYDTQNIDADRLIVGSTGQEHLKAVNYSKTYDSIVFAEDNPTAKELNTFMAKSSSYHKIIVYYPKYVTLLSQSVGVVDITHTESFLKKSQEDEIHIIFEPELVKIIAFFESQVRINLFKRVLFECDIARTSARLISMSSAEDRADGLIKEKKVHLRKAIASNINAKLLETFTGLTKWQNEGR